MNVNGIMKVNAVPSGPGIPANILDRKYRLNPPKTTLQSSRE
jgi:hypothetical protein